MRVLILHQNRYYKVKYDIAIDHNRVDVCYAGTQEYLDQIPAGLRHSVFKFEKEPIKAPLASWMRTQPQFDRILTRQENLLMMAAELREEFGISGMSIEQTILFRDKVKMKHAVAQAGLRVPRNVRITNTLNTLSWAGKTVLKPVDAAGSQGISLFDTAEAALKNVKQTIQADPEHEYLRHFELEEFIEGPIWHVDGYLFQGKPVAIKTNKYIGTCLDYAFGDPVGSVQYDNPQLAEWAIQCMSALGAQTVTFHLEAIMAHDGPVFLEVAGRAGGGDIVEIFERATGVQLHVLDMASDVEGKVVERFAKVKPSQKKYGFFLLPGHQLKGAPCRVLGADEMLKSPLLENYHMLTPQDPTPKKATYQALDVPLSGIVSGASSEELEMWMLELFAKARVVPADS